MALSDSHRFYLQESVSCVNDWCFIMDSVIRKYSSMLSKSLDNIDKIAEGNTEDAHDVITSKGIVKKEDLAFLFSPDFSLEGQQVKAYNNDDNTTYEWVDADAVINEIGDSLNTVKINLAGLATLRDLPEGSVAEYVTMFNSNLSDLGLDPTSLAKRLSGPVSNVKSILVSGGSAAQKAIGALRNFMFNETSGFTGFDSLEGYAAGEYLATNGVTGYVYHLVQMDWSSALAVAENIWNVVKSLWNKTCSRIGSWFGDLWSKAESVYNTYFGQACYIKANVKGSRFCFDKGSIRGTTTTNLTTTNLSRITSKFASKQGAILHCAVPGGDLYISNPHIVTSTTTSYSTKIAYDWHFVPTIDAYKLQGFYKGWTTNLYDADHWAATCLEFMAQDHRKIQDQLYDHEMPPFDWSSIDTCKYIGYAMQISISMFLKFIRSYGDAYGDMNEQGSVLRDMLDTNTNRLDHLYVTDSAVKMIGLIDRDLGNTYGLESLSEQRHWSGMSAFLEDLTDLAIFDPEQDDFGYPFEWTNNMPLGSLHIISANEFGDQFLSFVGKTLGIVAVISAAVIITKYMVGMRRRAATAQGAADLYLYSSDFTGSKNDWNTWWKLQKRANRLSRMLGESEASISLIAETARQGFGMNYEKTDLESAHVKSYVGQRTNALSGDIWRECTNVSSNVNTASSNTDGKIIEVLKKIDPNYNAS